MLTLATGADRAKLERFCKGSLLGTYLGSRLRCYGFGFDFVRFWLGEADGEICAVLGTLDSAAVLLAAPSADHEELSAFLRMQSFSSMMTAAKTAERCGLENYVKKQAFVFTGGEAVRPAPEPDDMKAVYALISREIPGSFSAAREAYLSFLSDYTFRKNRGAARAAALTEQGALCACALTAAETDQAAVLSGVAVDPRFRGKGFGRRVVLSLANALQAEGKTAYVIALNDSAAQFYARIGFAPYRELAIIERTAYV